MFTSIILKKNKILIINKKIIGVTASIFIKTIYVLSYLLSINDNYSKINNTNKLSVLSILCLFSEIQYVQVIRGNT